MFTEYISEAAKIQRRMKVCSASPTSEVYGEEQESKEVKQHLKNKKQLYYLTNTFWSVAFIKVTMTVMTTGKKTYIKSQIKSRCAENKCIYK